MTDTPRSGWHFSSMLVVAAIVAAPKHAGAQSPVAPAVGSWVRVVTDSASTYIVGELISITRDSVVIHQPIAIAVSQQARRADTVAVSMPAVRRFELRTAVHRQTWRGAKLGVASGAMLLAAVAAATFRPCDCISAFNSRSATASFGAFDGAIVGGVLGAIIGASVASEDWLQVDVRASTRVGFAPNAHGLGARLTHSFH